jgi:hypothetical protein
MVALTRVIFIIGIFVMVLLFAVIIILPQIEAGFEKGVAIAGEEDEFEEGEDVTGGLIAAPAFLTTDTTEEKVFKLFKEFDFRYPHTVSGDDLIFNTFKIKKTGSPTAYGLESSVKDGIEEWGNKYGIDLPSDEKITVDVKSIPDTIRIDIRFTYTDKIDEIVVEID